MTTDIVTAKALKIKICEVLGLDPNKVSRIVIDISAALEPLRVDVEMFAGSDLVNVEWSADAMEVHKEEA